MRLRLVPTLLLTSLFAHPALAQIMEFACPAPGTTITYDSGVVVISRGQDGMDCKMDTVGGRPFKIRSLILANPSADGTDISGFVNALKPERLWPLAVGKKVEANFTAGGKNWHYILSVAKYEKRTGPGDALIDTFLIEMNEQGPDGFRSISRWWVSPVDKFAVRFDASNSEGRANRAVVTSIKRP